MGFYHACDVQIFNRNFVILANDAERCLMMKIFALIGYLLMLARKQNGGLASPTVPLTATAYFALRPLQSFLCHAQVLWISYHLTVAKCSEVLYTNVHAARIAGLRHEAALIFFNGKNRVPAIRRAFDRTGFNLAFNLSMLNDLHLANLRQVKPPAFDLKGTLGLREGETIEASAALESRITRLIACFDAAKERLKGFAQAAQGVLQNLRINLRNVLAEFFDLWKLNRLRVVVDGLSTSYVGVTALLQAGIVNFAADHKPLLKRALNARRWFQFELVGFHCEACSTQLFRVMQGRIIVLCTMRNSSAE
jgi:hypothetical protein